MNEIKFECFAVGRWNSMDFSRADLLEIVAAFTALGDRHRVPIKLGHNKDQKVTDGEPALGWVRALEVIGEKLVATAVDVPDILMKAISKKLFRTCSIELDIEVVHQGNQYPRVLSGIAILGADIPAVNVLNDLTHYLSQRSDFAAGSRMVFSAIEGNRNTTNSTKGESDMELLERIAELEEENASLKSTTLNFERANHKASIDSKRAQVAELLERGVKAELITPAQRTQFSKLLRVDDDESLQGIEVADVQALVAGGKLRTFGRDQGKQGAVEDNRTPDQRLADEIREMLVRKEAPDFITAQKILFQREPELARAYINQNQGE